MQAFVKKDKDLQALFRKRNADYVLAPNQAEDGSVDASRANGHGDFDDDAATVKATLARILGKSSIKTTINFPRSASSKRDLRKRLS
jgi:hypothetical protein